MKKALAVVVMVWMVAGQGSAGSAQETNITLNEVVVTATKTEKDPRDVTQSVTVLTGDEIRKSSATTVSEAVERAVGVTVVDQGPKGALQTLSLRGADYSHVLVLLDGKRLNSPRDSGFDLSALPVLIDDIERIEIVRGASSALYGADAMGGVVNIITKKPAGSQTRIGGSIGSRGYDTLFADNSGRQGAWYYTFSGIRETYDGYRPNSDLDQGTISGKIGYDISGTSSIEFTGNYIGKENGAPGSAQFPSLTARQLERGRVYGIGYREKLSKTVDIKLSGYRNEDDLQFKDPGAFFPVNSRHESRTDGSEAQLSWLANSWNLFTIGYETRRDSLQSTDSGDHTTSLEATYLQDEISVGDSLILVVGDRFDKHSVYGEKASPRISGRYLFQGPGTILRASYGKSFRAPTFNDLFWTDPFGNVGNKDLRPENAKEYEAGIEQPMGKGSAVKVSWFERKVRDMINWQEYAPFQYTPVNIGKADIKGVEAEAVFRTSDATTWAANYTYMNPVDDSTGERIYSVSIPKTQIKGSLSIALDPEVHLYLEGRVVENYVRPGEPEWKYSVMDGKIAQTLADKKSEVFFGMKNIFDRKYETAKGYPMPPKEIFGGVSYLF